MASVLCKKFLILFLTLMISIVLYSCFKPQEAEKRSGASQDEILNYFPTMFGIESCQWTYEQLPSSRFAVGSTSFIFYGHIKFNDDYVKEMMQLYTWEEYTGENDDIPFLKEISKDKTLFFSDEYSMDIGSTNYFIQMLRYNDLIYFYLGN